ncbi:MAG: FG-GAP-like repeat-containing protein [Bacteroidota bacterium]|nr:FG-GAP-like repeat-containing protein [Bacteroidota bacterium]
MLRVRSQIVLIFLFVVALGCGGPRNPQPGSEAYNSTVSAFYAGVSAMEVGEDLRANAKLTLVTELAPMEPAAWANLALMAMRRNELEVAQEHLSQALSLDSTNSGILLLAAAHARMLGDETAQAHNLQKAVGSDPLNARALFDLVHLLPDSSDEIPVLMERLDNSVPGNTSVLLKRLEQSVTLGTLDVELLDELASHQWGPDVNEQIQALREAVSETGDAATQLAFLRNVLLSEPQYRQDLASVRVPIERVGDPITRFIRLESPTSTPAALDDSLQFVADQSLMPTDEPQEWIAALALGNDALPAIFYAGRDSVKTLREEAWKAPGVSGHDAGIGIDFDFDFRTDIILAGTDGIRLLRQDSLEQFADVTATLGLESAITGAAYTGIWAADIDLEGDIDLLLNTAQNELLALRNNGDGTFEPEDWFSGVSGIKAFAWADFDQDGDPDAGFVDAEGSLVVMQNERQGRFTSMPVPVFAAEFTPLDVTVSDSNSDGKIELLVLADTGQVLRVTFGYQETVEVLAQVDLQTSSAQILTGDLDNNGGVDLVVTEAAQSHILLQDQDYAFHSRAGPVDLEAYALSATRFAGRLDLIGLDADRQPTRFGVLTTKGYHWKQIQPRAAQAVGDQRINSFGIGGEVEIRAGLLYQKQPITQPIVHFGLGTQSLADVARITWPNGSVQAEFDMLSDEIVSATQRLKGSCPWLFTWDGDEMTFVTDFIWRSPLGLRINAQETAGIMTTEDWVKIRGDQLQPREGYYDVRITAELWETHFFDHISLMVVDHPVGTEVFVDERFAFPPPELKVHVTGELVPITGAWDDRGKDVLELVAVQDEKYADFFGRGDYQGITRHHYLEVEISDETPQDAWLIARGWIRPTDSSINVAISQGQHAAPSGLRVEAQLPDGSWEIVHANLGFPSGKSKTVLIDLVPAVRELGARRLRLHTNMEIYWDVLHTAAKLSDSDRQITSLLPAEADLKYRGFSVVSEADRSSPEFPEYSTLSGTVQVWRDLIGYHTRFGDVLPLLEKVDDRYVIMNAADEMQLRFAEINPVEAGWQRDFVLVGDGWVKDGDYNTTFSTTLRPLPSHGDPTYDEPPSRLQADPVYKRHSSDWQEYHTRYVVPEDYSRGLRIENENQ